MEPSGVLVINKSDGMTSHDVVNKIRRIYGTKRVGHTGTLDPLATGVLVVLIGRATKAAEYLSADKKGYKATLRLGITTDTEDTTGTVLTKYADPLPSYDEVTSVLKNFTGDLTQIPPMYSAIKVNGQKLYDLARKGVTVERESRPITIYSISCTKTDVESDFILDVECSAGTYIRTLCADIGAKLGCGAAMATLCRTSAGGFSIDNAYTLDQLAEMSENELISLLKPTEELFSDLPAVKLPAFYEKLSRSGCEIYQSKIKTAYPVDTFIRISDKDGFFALGQVKEYENGTAIKALKLFRL